MSSYNLQRTHFKFMTTPGDKEGMCYFTGEKLRLRQVRRFVSAHLPASDRRAALMGPLERDLFLFLAFSTWGKGTSYSCLSFNFYYSFSVASAAEVISDWCFNPGFIKILLDLSGLMVLARKRNRKSLFKKVLSINYYSLHQRLADFSHCAILNTVAPPIQTSEGLSSFTDIYW